MLTFHWKLLTGLGAAVSLGLALALLSSHIANGVLTDTVAQRDAQIETLNGDLAQSRVNTETVKSALERQVSDLRVKAAEDAATLADTTRRLAAVRAAPPRTEILVAPPKGDTLDARVRDVDARLLETLK